MKKLLGIEAQTIILFFTLLAATYIGYQQNNINNELKNIASKELIFSKSPLLNVDFYKFEYNPIRKVLIEDVKFSNKGSVPLNILNYEIDYSQNKSKWSPIQQDISGTLFQGETVIKGIDIHAPVETIFQDLQLIVIKVSFASIFDQAKQFCIERKYIYDLNRNELEMMGMVETAECN